MNLNQLPCFSKGKAKPSVVVEPQETTLQAKLSCRPFRLQPEQQRRRVPRQDRAAG